MTELDHACVVSIHWQRRGATITLDGTSHFCPNPARSRPSSLRVQEPQSDQALTPRSQDTRKGAYGGNRKEGKNQFRSCRGSFVMDLLYSFGGLDITYENPGGLTSTPRAEPCSSLSFANHTTSDSKRSTDAMFLAPRTNAGTNTIRA